MTDRTTVTVDPATGEIIDIDGDLPPERALVPVREVPRGLARPETPTEMVALASQMASALKDIVERQRLYAVISGRKFPTVEAWMTIARMDNVVAREAERPSRHDDGSWEATVELIRLSDGMVIGKASALCGTPDDKPWASRAEPARRSMAVTRATSRAFRQQYSWIMALAGYEPTPAEEMPRDEPPKPEPTPADPDGLIGVAEVGKGDADMELRQTPEGYRIAFRLRGDKGGIKVEAYSPLAEEIATYRESIEGQRVQAYGRIRDESYTPKGSTRAVTYQVLLADRLAVPGLGTLPLPVEAPTEPMFTADEQAAIDAAMEGKLDGLHSA